MHTQNNTGTRPNNKLEILADIVASDNVRTTLTGNQLSFTELLGSTPKDWKEAFCMSVITPAQEILLVTEFNREDGEFLVEAEVTLTDKELNTLHTMLTFVDGKFVASFNDELVDRLAELEVA